MPRRQSISLQDELMGELGLKKKHGSLEKSGTMAPGALLAAAQGRLRRGKSKGPGTLYRVHPEEKEKVEVAFEGFKTYKFLDFVDITPVKLRAMTSILVPHAVHEHKAFGFLRHVSMDHQGRPRAALNRLTYLLAFYALCSMPIFVVFGYEMFPPFQHMQVVVMCVFVLDLLATSVTTFQSHDGQEVTGHVKMMKRYVLSWYFAADLLAAVPYALYQSEDILARNFRYDWDLADPTDKYPASLVSLAQLALLLAKFVRCSRRMKRNGVYNDSNLWYGFSFFTTVVVLLQSATVINFVCCQTQHSIFFEMAVVGEKEATVAERSSLFFVRYVVYLHATVVYIIGKGDPTSTAERLYGLFCNVFGLFLTASIVGQATHLIQNWNAKETKWRIKINEVNDSMMQMGISMELKVRIRSYYAFSWAINGGEDKGHKWLSDLSKSYHEEAAIQVNENLIGTVPIFKEANKEFVHRVILDLKQQLYLPGDYIIKHGDIGDEMYFVVRGTVQAMDKLESIVYTVLHEGSFFGEIALLKKNSKRTATVRSYTYSQLNVLYKADFENILSEFPADALLLEKEANKRERNSDNVNKIKEKRTRKQERARSGFAPESSGSSSDLANAGPTHEGQPSQGQPASSHSSQNRRSSAAALVVGAVRNTLLGKGRAESRDENKNTIKGLDAEGEMEAFLAKSQQEETTGDLLEAIKILSLQLQRNIGSNSAAAGASAEDAQEKQAHVDGILQEVSTLRLSRAASNTHAPLSVPPAQADNGHDHTETKGDDIVADDVAKNIT